MIFWNSFEQFEFVAAGLLATIAHGALVVCQVTSWAALRRQSRPSSHVSADVSGASVLVEMIEP